MYPGYETLRRLRNGEVVEVQGLRLKMTEGKDHGSLLMPGDLYIGARNTVRLLTVEQVDLDNGWVSPTTVDYPFDLGECVGVEEPPEDSMPRPGDYEKEN